ncbi:putative 4-mercaptohistidine N1-methyltransferase [Verrucomicrobia bacterium LW23]|nr:putative 4-mercaptohistidine N1-methyltransferase [Verrucomicrobia bacterium LW23]
MPYYESDKGLSEYLLFHYGTEEQLLPEFAREFAPPGALEYPARCVHQLLSQALDAGAALAPDGRGRALDLGCAVGRSTLELTCWCEEVIGIDYSQRFVDAAEQMRRDGEMGGAIAVEGDVYEYATFVSPGRLPSFPAGHGRQEVAGVPIAPQRARFMRGDAQELPLEELGTFDIVLMANLIDRLADPRRCLAQMPALVRPGGLLLITSPYTWLQEYTPSANWLQAGAPQSPPSTLGGLHTALDPHFTLLTTANLPFLIREHARKYQWSIAHGTVWKRRG